MILDNEKKMYSIFKNNVKFQVVVIRKMVQNGLNRNIR